ncbi:MAG: glycosyltransferase family protein [Candidatus Acidiferrales bacterium]
MKIVFLGNFCVPYSTESHHRWTWEKLGHQVVALQENKATTDQVVEACKDAQLFQWTHTHGFVTSGSILLTEMLDRIHEMGVKTFSYHLDVYWGLNQWDKREDNIGKHPSWRVQHFFSTVGDRDDDFKHRSVNHHWLPPGVVESGCFEGTFQPNLACDVGFTGSVNYHPEYPFRDIMVKALRARYGPSFRVFQGVREQSLNDLYASCKVLVGDHCFAGRPKYWSDRLPETCGRGGFIVYPLTEGMTIPAATYLPQSVGHLVEKIDYYLENAEKREVIRKRCFGHVKAHDTYTHRLQKILEVMELA